MNSALVLLVQVRIRAVSIVMDTSGLQETALSQGVCVCVCLCVVHKGRNIFSFVEVFNYVTHLSATTAGVLSIFMQH